MLRKSIVLLILIATIYWSFSSLMPSNISDLETDKNSFSTERALVHLKEISKAPHYFGSVEHKTVRDYIIKSLEDLGLETQTQEGYSMSKWGNMSKPINILARIKGSDNSKALMLLSHYDSSPHSSYGASDAGSGVVTILEGLRAYLNTGKTPKNDIIILISDAEELGLNGADTFVNQHPWAKDVGLVLNFESRGSGGPSYMLIETNGGNHNLMKGYVKANPKFPVANSLVYSIYKMLPNDTDLTIFRRDGDIDGFNFAFIDDHYDYHTALDTYERLDRNTLEHQGSYIMPMLHYFADANLNNLKSDTDDIFFSMPLFKTVMYPFSWIFPMLILSFIAFFILIYIGIKNSTLSYKEMGKGFAPLLLSLFVNGLIGYFGWSILKNIYPQYGEMLHGFTYNGYLYILAFTLLSIAICLFIYHKMYKPKNTGELLVAPLFLWLIICTLFAFKLKGASFFIIPVIFGLITLFVFVKQQKPNLYLLTLLSIPLLLIISPFVKMFPVGLGLDTIVASTILASLMFVLLIGVFASYRRKNKLALLCFAISLLLFVFAHLKSDFNEQRPKPNSLVYALNLDDNTAVWASYDNILDDWTKAYLSDNPNDANALSKNTLGSKYNSGFTYSRAANIKNIEPPSIEITKDTIINENRHIQLFILPKRHINRLELFSDSTNHFISFSINGLKVPKKGNEMVFQNRWRNRLFSYYAAQDQYLELEFTVPKNQKTTIELYEASFDLLSNPLFDVPERPSSMIPKPFILNDAVIIKKTIRIN